VVPAVFLIPRPAVPWRTLATVGLFLSFGQFAFLYSALAAGMPAGLASLVLQAQVMLTVLLAALRLHERPTARQLVGIVIGAAGLAIVASGRSAATPVVGLLPHYRGGPCPWASGNIASRRASVASGLSMTVWSALFAPLPLFALSLLIDGPHQVSTALTHLNRGQPALHRLYRLPGLPGRLRDLEHPAGPAPGRARGPVHAPGAAGRDGDRLAGPGERAGRSRWPAAWCCCWAWP
jgi:hypothetical protein